MIFHKIPLDFPYEISREGVLRHSVSKKVKKIGIGKRGYRTTILYNKGKYKSVYLHRLLAATFLKNFSDFPIVDHIDRDTLNNRLDNLRMISYSGSSQNTSVQSNSSTGHKGVSFSATPGKFVAQIHVNNKKIHLGTFGSIEEAVAAYAEAQKEYHFELDI